MRIPRMTKSYSKPKQVRAIALSDEQHTKLQEISDKTGLKMVELHRLAIGNLLHHVKQSGTLPTPELERVCCEN